jgi:glycine dehydrogenase
MPVSFAPAETFTDRHLGPRPSEVQEMLEQIDFDSVDELIDETIPASIRTSHALDLPGAQTERELLEDVEAIAAENEQYRSFIGMGYHDTLTPPVIQRGILENPGWYTQYTPYQSEISQGRLQALLNFQTMVIDLTGLPVANASLLDESTAAAEAMSMLHDAHRGRRARFFVSQKTHPQTIAVLRTRAAPVGIELVVGDWEEVDLDESYFGVLLQYPTTDGAVRDYTDFCDRAAEAGAYVAVAADLMSLALLRPPGEFGADVAVGSTQRFGVPVGYGGPHAAYFATTEQFQRKIPGRIIGVSVDEQGDPALRMALQTREQHIRRERATSNICTAQVLLGVMASMYAVYHGPEGLREIALRIHDLTKLLAHGLELQGYSVRYSDYFDTIRVDMDPSSQDRITGAAHEERINLRYYDDGSVGISLDEPTTREELQTLLNIFDREEEAGGSVEELAEAVDSGYHGQMLRESGYLEHPVFNRYHSETELMRYMDRLQRKDLSLTEGMIPLGSCTMKLNPTAALMPITRERFNRLHPFAPPEQAKGYEIIIRQLSKYLSEITGFPGVTLQPNSGAQGEYTGLLVIREYHRRNGGSDRDVCLIPESAHGTNPASAVMAGMEVVVVDCDSAGNVDLSDVRSKAQQYRERLAAIMITYPSTHGVFERDIQEICDIVHDYGGQVYMDGANMNAQVGLCRPGEYGVDVCHLNLHKTFSIPHGGGGPGVGPVCAAEHLAPYLPSHPIIPVGGAQGIGPVAQAPWGSANILLISWGFIRLLGAEGLTEASKTAVLNANYMASCLREYYPIAYTGPSQTVAHEFIIDFREIRRTTGITEEDVAKRLMDYGFHAPTMSWPVPGSMMVEPTESEDKRELDRFCEALISIREEIDAVARGEVDEENNVLKRAPHTTEIATGDDWDRPYSREKAVFPAAWTRKHKFWPSVSRVDNAYGDRNLMCACPPVEAYAGKEAALSEM